MPKDALDQGQQETFWYYENGEQSKSFKTEEEGHAWIEQNDPEGVLWEAKRGPRQPPGSADKDDVPLATE
jgi:hypothetical protein